jgi:hypothetical protein
MNIGFAGPRLSFAPGADPGDGLLDVCLLPVDRRAAMAAWLDTDEPDRPAPLVRLRGRTVVFAWYRAPLRIDDDLLFPDDVPGGGPPAGGAQQVTAALEGRRIEILLPGDSSDRPEADDPAAQEVNA